MAVRVDQLMPGDKILVKLKKTFRISTQGTNPISAAKQHSKGVVAEFIATVMEQGTYEGKPSMRVMWMHRINQNNHGEAMIPYQAIQHLWRYNGAKTSPVRDRTPTEDRTVPSTTDTWPYAASQFPAMDIYNEKIDLRWATNV